MNKKAKTNEDNEKRYHTAIENLSDELLIKTAKAEKEANKYYDKMAEGNFTEEEAKRAEDTVKSLWRAVKNLRKAYQRSISVADEFTARWDDIKNSKKKHIIPAAPANSLVDVKEKDLRHFTEGMNVYKLLWVCFLGSFFGVIIEMLWCLLMEGHIESRAGLVWGPFNLLYGVGAVVITAFLYKYRNKGKWLAFIGGLVGGSLVEYGCSWLQEVVFGSVSWDYSEMPFNINGRICLAYSVMWGFLGVLWIKSLYPRLSYMMLKMPSKTGKVITWVLVGFFVINAAVSAVAVFRWSQRIDGIEAANAFWQFIDSRFTDERMSRIFCNMKF